MFLLQRSAYLRRKTDLKTLLFGAVNEHCTMFLRYSQRSCIVRDMLICPARKPLGSVFLNKAVLNSLTYVVHVEVGTVWLSRHHTYPGDLETTFVGRQAKFWSGAVPVQKERAQESSFGKSRRLPHTHPANGSATIPIIQFET